MVELIHQKLHSSRANLRNRSASVMFYGNIPLHKFKDTNNCEIRHLLSRQKKRIIAASVEAVISQFLQPNSGRIGDYS